MKDNVEKSILNVLFVGKIDPWSLLPCGIRGYFFGLLKPFIDRKIFITLIGTTMTKNEGNLKEFNFIDLSMGCKKLINSQVFFNLALFFHFIKMKLNGDLLKFDIIHIQRIDQALPFIFSHKPVVCTFHGIASEQARNKHGIITYFLVKKIEEIVILKIDYAIIVSEEIRNYYIKKFPSIRHKLTVINNGVDINCFKPYNKSIVRKKFGFDPNEKIILYMGRFHEEKNLNLLISSFNHLIHFNNFKARLVLIGEGRIKNQIIDIVNKRNLQNIVSIFEPIDDADVPELMCCADVYALSSYVEGFPLVILQSLACDIPVVTTDVGEVSKVIIDGKTGFLIHDFSIEMFADRLKYVLTNPDRFKGQCIEVVKDYTWDSVAEKTLEIYQKILENRRMAF